jgi:hypothetical protein
VYREEWAGDVSIGKENLEGFSAQKLHLCCNFTIDTHLD